MKEIARRIVSGYLETLPRNKEVLFAIFDVNSGDDDILLKHLIEMKKVINGAIKEIKEEKCKKKN